MRLPFDIIGMGQAALPTGDHMTAYVYAQSLIAEDRVYMPAPDGREGVGTVHSVDTRGLYTHVTVHQYIRLRLKVWILKANRYDLWRIE